MFSSGRDQERDTLMQAVLSGQWQIRQSNCDISSNCAKMYFLSVLVISIIYIMSQTQGLCD